MSDRHRCGGVGAKVGLACVSLACMAPACGSPASELLAQATPVAPTVWLRGSVTPPNATTPNSATRSVVLDPTAAASARERFAPVYVESIVVEGRDPDARPRKTQSLENRFAQALLAPPTAGVAGLRALNTTPCMSMPSTWNSIGNSYTPLTGCP